MTTAPFTQALEHGEALHVRKSEVQNHGVWPGSLCNLYSLPAAASFDDVVALLFQTEAQKAADLGIFFNHEDRAKLWRRCDWHSNRQRIDRNGFRASLTSTGVPSPCGPVGRWTWTPRRVNSEVNVSVELHSKSTRHHN